MTTPPDDRSFRREMATAYRSGWHFIDLVTAIPHSGDSLMVTLFGEPVVVARDSDDDIRAYRCLRRPRGAPKPVRCAVRYGMIFVNLDQRDHHLVDSDVPARVFSSHCGKNEFVRNRCWRAGFSRGDFQT
jgi:phenylpropionate dioxygenase-like ring-hydroxylating dioxygenase large terminal subunit